MFTELKKEHVEHSKKKSINYWTFQSQEYLKTHMKNNHEVSLVLALRSKTVKQFEANFPYFNENKCPMCSKEEETQ